MRDLDKERELLERAGLAAGDHGSEALAAVKVWDASAATETEATMRAAKGHNESVGGAILTHRVLRPRPRPLPLRSSPGGNLALNI